MVTKQNEGMSLLEIARKLQIADYNQPPDYTNWNPKAHYDFVDFGCGSDPKRVLAVALQHSDWNVLGIDPQIEKTSIEGKVELVKAKADEILERLADGSVRYANFDYLLNNLQLFSRFISNQFDPM